MLLQEHAGRGAMPLGPLREQDQSVERRYESLIRMAQAIRQQRDPTGLFRLVAEELRRVVPFDAIAQFDEASNKVHMSGDCGRKDAPPPIEIAPHETLAWWTYKNQKPLVIPYVNLETRFPGMIELFKQYGIQSACALPLSTAHRRLGSLMIASRIPDAYNQQQIQFLSLVADQIALALDDALNVQALREAQERLEQEKLYLEDEIRTELNFEEIIGTSAALRRVLKEVETVAPTDSTVIIYGETGTGKELIARALHELGARRTNAFVKLNCAAIPAGLLESEMFGHERGAFTGAISQRIGRFELANRGTVFLDEIGEIPLELQPKLLRVLQEREFERLGSSRTLRTDARLIAATNRDLAHMVEEQKFRPDLFYRLSVFPIHVPALRERPEDIPLLVRHFVQQFCRRNGKNIETIPSSAMTALTRYHWPGNIRELQNVIERAVILSTGTVLNVSIGDLKPRIPAGIRDSLKEAERAQIRAALEQSNWVIAGPNGAAARLGLKRSTLQFRMHKLGIRVARSVAASP